MTDRQKHCCDMHQKVALGVMKIYSEKECGLPDSILADFHDFSYQSPTGAPVAVALSTKYCPWCGAQRIDPSMKRTTEVVRFYERGD